MVLHVHIEQLFQVFDQSAAYIAKQTGRSYLEALAITVEQVYEEELLLDYSEEEEKVLSQLYSSVQLQVYSKEELRRGFQLAVLKGFKEVATVGALVTPDAVAMLIGYLAQQLIQPSVIYNPGAGTGNLLTCVMNQYKHEMQGYGSEVDPLFIRIAYVNANLQQHTIELHRQDALQASFAPAADLTISDLPIGAYLDDAQAKAYQLYSEDNPPLIHQLMLEHALLRTKPGGYLLFIIPNFLFTEQGSDKLRQWVTEQSYVQAVLQLPASLFQKGSIHKSVFILQKKGEGVHKPKQTLLANLPPFSKQEAFAQSMEQIKEWIHNEKGTYQR